MKLLKLNFLIIDIGFILYWTITYFKLIPESLLFPDYNNPILVIWNWSFFPLDIFISITGITSLILLNNLNSAWFYAALGSLFLTFASGLMAISFWVIQGWFDLSWWLPNLYLMIYPIPMIYFLVKKKVGESLQIPK
jgi:hypothetical protein